MALKIVKSAKQYTEVARDEIALLKKVTEGDKDDSHCVVHLIDSFDHMGPNGIRTWHTCRETRIWSVIRILLRFSAPVLV